MNEGKTAMDQSTNTRRHLRHLLLSWQNPCSGQLRRGWAVLLHVLLLPLLLFVLPAWAQETVCGRP